MDELSVVVSHGSYLLSVLGLQAKLENLDAVLWRADAWGYHALDKSVAASLPALGLGPNIGWDRRGKTPISSYLLRGTSFDRRGAAAS